MCSLHFKTLSSDSRVIIPKDLSKTTELGSHLRSFCHERFSSDSDFLSELNRTTVASVMQTLFCEGYVEVRGIDSIVRPLVVQTQKYIENMLSIFQRDKEANTVCITHTPTPATPFCKRATAYQSTFLPGDQRERTITDRMVTTRELLDHGASHYIVYSDSQKHQRSAEQLAIYDEQLAHYATLFDSPIQGTVSEDFSGASYFIRYREDLYVFSLNMTQSGSVSNDTDYTAKLWFGRFSSHDAGSKGESVLHTLKDNGVLPILP